MTPSLMPAPDSAEVEAKLRAIEAGRPASMAPGALPHDPLAREIAWLESAQGSDLSPEAVRATLAPISNPRIAARARALVTLRAHPIDWEATPGIDEPLARSFYLALASGRGPSPEKSALLTALREDTLNPDTISALTAWCGTHRRALVVADPAWFRRLRLATHRALLRKRLRPVTLPRLPAFGFGGWFVGFLGIKLLIAAAGSLAETIALPVIFLVLLLILGTALVFVWNTVIRML